MPFKSFSLINNALFMQLVSMKYLIVELDLEIKTCDAS
jgi:hypothetical protein